MKLTHAVRAYLRGTPAHTFTPSPDPQCAAFAKSGARCRLPKASGSDKCVIHKAKM